MKTKLLTLLAAIAIIFTACQPEEITGKNELVFNGNTYELTSSVSLSDGKYILGAQTQIADGNTSPEFIFTCNLYEEGFNKTFDLTEGPIEGNAGYFLSFNPFANGNTNDLWMFRNENGAMRGAIGETHYPNNTVFKSGTMTTVSDDDKYSIQLSGVLKNDKNFSIEFFIPKE